MSAISFSRFFNTNVLFYSPTGTLPSSCDFLVSYHSLFPKFLPRPHILSLSPSIGLSPVRSMSSEAEELPVPEDEWLKKLPEKKKPLYSHSLPCVEYWLSNLGFYQIKEDRAVWLIQKHEWHAQLSLDVTDLYIRYLKSGPGNLDKDVERRFSYALSREDIENAVLGGP